MQAICTANVGFRPCSSDSGGFSGPGCPRSLALESKANKLINAIFPRGGRGDRRRNVTPLPKFACICLCLPPPAASPHHRTTHRPARTPAPAPALTAPLNKAEKTTCVKEETLSVMSLLGNEITRNPALQITHREDHFPHAA